MWKIKLDTSNNPIMTDTNVAASFHFKDNEIDNNGYIAGVRPTWDSAGNVHFIWNDDNQNMHYSVFNWVKGNFDFSKLLYPKVIHTVMRAVWVGTKSEAAQGITMFQAYIGASMTTINTPT